MNKFVISTNDLTVEQKVLETLSLYPKLSIEELVVKSGLDKKTIKKVLHSHSMKFYSPILSINKKILNIHENSIGKKNNPKYWDFIQHNLINISHNNSKREETYELSLFGVFLVLKFIRYFYIHQKNKKLYFSNISFIHYFEKIIKNYNFKLPLIFGKWQFLKGILKNYAIYNFDKLINDLFLQQENFSISRGGNNEFFSGIRELILQTLLQYGEFANAGMACYLICIQGSKPSFPNIEEKNYASYYLQTYFPIIGEAESKRTQYLVSKFFDMIYLLNPVERIIENTNSISQNQNYYLIRKFENLFAHEISAYYYFNLFFDYEFFYIMNTDSKKSESPRSWKPKECLNEILKLDNDISNFCLSWYQDIKTLQKSIQQNLEESIKVI